jgi:tyrosine decarboxylase MnfA
MLPREFPQRSVSPTEALAALHALGGRQVRYEDGRVLNSICTRPLPVAIEAFRRFAHTNLGDNRLFPAAVELEQAVVGMIADLVEWQGAVGNLVSGGTEANLLALWAAREQGRSPRAGRPEIAAGLGVHFSVEKAAALLGLELRRARLDGRGRTDIEDLEACINENTVALVATAGTSELGAVDDVEAVAELGRRHGIYVHVDAATGGFLIPFARGLGHRYPRFDLGVPGLCSITIDPHKYGLSVIPSGCVLFAHPRIQELVAWDSHYKGTQRHTTLLGTRPGGAAAATFAVLTTLGRPGFERLVAECFARRDLLVSELGQRGFTLVTSPELTIVGVRCADPDDVLRRLEEQGWFASVSRRLQALRIVVHRHTPPERLVEFVDALCGVQQGLVAVGGTA